MELKRKKSKVSYTIMISSDSAKKNTNGIHLQAGAVGTVTGLVFILVVLAVCYVVYSSITLSDSLERSKRQMEQIAQLQEEKVQLEGERDELAGKVSILSETVNQKVEVEQAMAAEQEEMHFPKGFPLSGPAQIKTEDDETNDNAEDEDTEQQEAVGITLEKEIVFTAAGGINVIASGSGTVLSVEADTAYGNAVSIEHGNGYVTTYRNGGIPMVKKGDEVIRGAILYVIGEENTELGYSIKEDDTYIDPMETIEING